MGIAFCTTTLFSTGREEDTRGLSLPDKPPLPPPLPLFAAPFSITKDPRRNEVVRSMVARSPRGVGGVGGLCTFKVGEEPEAEGEEDVPATSVPSVGGELPAE